MQEKSKDCFLVGGGKSVREGIATGLWDFLEGKDWWSLNYSAMFAECTPTREVFIDEKFYKENKEYIHKLSETVPIYCREFQSIKNNTLKCTMYDKSKGRFLTVKEMKQSNSLSVSEMGMTGEFALSLAVLEGYERIYIAGFDFGVSDPNDKDTHWYQYGLKNDPKKSRSHWWNQTCKLFSTGVGNPGTYFENNKLKKAIEFYNNYTTIHKQIYNVSMVSNITAFPKITYEQMYKMVEEQNG